MILRYVVLISSAIIAWSVLYIAQMHNTLISPVALQEKAVGDDTISIDEQVEKLLQSMTLAQKVGQMTQIDVSDVLYGKSRDPVLAINRARVAVYAKLGIGSYFNSPFDATIHPHGRTGWTATEWRMFLGSIQAIYKEHNAIPFIYGIDTTHGANYVQNATIFPQPLATASTFNPELAHAMGRIEAKDSIAAGIPWIFSPVLGIAMQPKWSRVYETFGEDPYLVSQMGVAVIRGIQSLNLSAACMKHFIGYSNPTSGNDRADSVITDFELLNYYAPPFIAAVRDGNVLSAMETYTSVNGDPVVQSRKLLVDLLRNDIQFDGLLVSDDDEIHRLVAEHHVARNELEALEMVMNHTSLDMNMVSEKHRSTSLLSKLINASHIPTSRLDDSVRRILKLKASLGLLPTSESEAAKHATITSNHLTSVGSQEDLQLAQTTADESIILLKNKMQEPIDAVNPKLVLPIIDPNSKIFITGPLAHNKAYLCGGWTVYWQGTDDSDQIPHGLTIKEALEARFKNVVHHEGVDIDGYADGEVRAPIADEEENILTLSAKYNTSLARAAAADYTIVVVGEAPYAEKSGDIDDLTLPQGQLDYITTLSSVKSTNVIVVIIAGRPRLLAKSLANVQAVLLSFLPCEAGGEAIAKVIAGDVNPSGRLPLTYPSSTGHIHVPYFHRMNIACKESFSECPVEWPFGSGLSYTTFKYDNLTLSEWRVNKENGTLGVQVAVTNTGTRAGKEVVMLFVSQKVRHFSVPETKMLRRFKKIDLPPGGVEIVHFELTSEDWSYYAPQIGNGFQSVAEEGLFHVLIKHDTTCNSVKKNSMCAHFHVV
ncbi:lysosomal beta glucosidase [Thraustotheca clavata]|uniref:beta-glucosidase n=1 Tax=Thraustotheca clavata TaxID=74557 RepID=A0A1V9YY64_9STRA|nr:lysosomal beta glucosidase [Thraustotheca clavata]